MIILCVLLGLRNTSYENCGGGEYISYEIFYQKALCFQDIHTKYDKARNINYMIQYIYSYCGLTY